MAKITLYHLGDPIKTINIPGSVRDADGAADEEKIRRHIIGQLPDGVSTHDVFIHGKRQALHRYYRHFAHGQHMYKFTLYIDDLTISELEKHLSDNIPHACLPVFTQHALLLASLGVKNEEIAQRLTALYCSVENYFRN